MLGTFRYSSQWLVIDCDPEIGRYYRHLFHLMTHRCYKLQRPAWESHITVVQNEESINKSNWGKYNGHEVEFDIINEAGNDGEYYWFPISCKLALDIREELGLGPPVHPLHISIGLVVPSKP